MVLAASDQRGPEQGEPIAVAQLEVGKGPVIVRASDDDLPHFLAGVEEFDAALEDSLAAEVFIEL